MCEMKKNKIFGSRLKIMLKRKNMNQAALSSHLTEKGHRITEQSISHWVNYISQPTQANIDNVSEELQVFPEYLSGEIDYPTIEDWKKSRYDLSPDQCKAIKIYLSAFGYSIPDDFYFHEIIEMNKDGDKIVIDRMHLLDLVRQFMTMIDSYCLPYELLNKNKKMG